MVVEDGLALTDAPLAALRPFVGDHVYVFAPEAVSVTLPSGAMEGDAGVMVMTGGDRWVSMTSSVDALQDPLEMVHRSVALEPAGMPVTVDVEDDGAVIVAVPLTTVHCPLPVAGVLPARVKVPELQAV